MTAGGVTRSFSYDGAGNIITDNDGGAVYGLGYNKGNRLRQVNLNGTPVYYYLYNALGERVKKTVGADLRHFHYDRDGKLIAETSTTGAVILEYAWLDGLPIGEFTNAPGGTPPASVQVDNGDAGASFTGNWTTATAGSGYIGSNYRQHVPETVPAGGIVIDNSSAQFSTLGIWTTETAPSGFEGSDYRRREPEAVAKTASWEIPGSQIPQTGSYKVYAKWPASSQHATDAPYSVTHAGGTSTVTANQRVNGGQWNLLGTYTFNSGTTYKVELSDAVAAGKVAADAIYVVSTAAPAAAFTWTPTLPSAGTWRVMVRWPASSGNTANAQYTVTHAGGTSTVTLNQKQNGGLWMSLGTYSLTPGAGHKVTLAASANGATIADAVLFAGPTVQPANLLYVHADHLGSPQKLTDASQATVWDGAFDPFGEEVAITGLAAMPLRFPGQYADEETGFSYNYFRDYEPVLGRYIQSDPIGLLGGVNTYGYAYQNPVMYVDPKGNFGLLGCLGGMLLSGGLDFANNLYEYGGDIRKAALCIDLTNVALGCLMGALLPTGTDVIRMGISSLRGGATGGQLADEAIGFGAGTAGKGALNHYLPSFRVNDLIGDPGCDCEDKKNNLPNMIEDLNEMLY